MTKLSTIFSIATCLAVAGCGDDGARPAVDAGGTDAGGATDGGGGGGDGTLTVHVYRVDDGASADADGVAVALDTGTGRLEGTTGAEGTFTFEGVDFVDGATVVAWEDGRVMIAVEVAEEPGAEVPIYLLPMGMPRDDLVTLSGTVASMDDTAHSLVVSGTNAGFDSGTGPGWMVDVVPDEAGTLAFLELQEITGLADRVGAFDFFNVALVDYAAPSSAATVDVDFATDGVTPTTVTGSLANPSSPRASSIVNSGEVFIRVSTRESGIFLGTTSSMAVSDGESTIDYELTYAELSGAEDPITSFIVTDTPEQSAVLVDGWPTAGAQDLAFLDPPMVTAPEFGADLGWGSIARWETADSETRTSIQVFDRDSGFLRAVLVVAPGRSSGTLPQPPGDTGVADVLAGGEVDGRVVHCDDTGAPQPWMCQRFARSRAFGVTP